MLSVVTQKLKNYSLTEIEPTSNYFNCIDANQQGRSTQSIMHLRCINRSTQSAFVLQPVVGNCQRPASSDDVAKELTLAICQTFCDSPSRSPVRNLECSTPDLFRGKSNEMLFKDDQFLNSIYVTPPTPPSEERQVLDSTKVSIGGHSFCRLVPGEKRKLSETDHSTSYCDWPESSDDEVCRLMCHTSSRQDIGGFKCSPSQLNIRCHRLFCADLKSTAEIDCVPPKRFCVIESNPRPSLNFVKMQKSSLENPYSLRKRRSARSRFNKLKRLGLPS